MRFRTEQIAEHPTGYSGNGLSLYTRRVSRARPAMMKREKKLPQDLIAKVERDLWKLNCRVLTEADPERLAKVRHNIEIKKRFLQELRARWEGKPS